MAPASKARVTSEVKGGDKFKQRMEEIARMLGKGNTLKVGYYEDANYPDGTSLPMVATVNEYGRTYQTKTGKTVVQPPRPFFRNMIDKNSKEWPKMLAALLKSTNYNMTYTLTTLGQEIVAELKDSILTGNYAPNAPSTIARKGKGKPPLIDTEHMLNSAAYKITTMEE